ncbi:MAG: hypothetical protein WD381_05205 [Balneolaceae bacterium]
MYIRLSTIIFLFVCSSFYACSGTKVMTPNQSDQELTVDGNLSDWSLGSSLLEESESVNYYVTHTENFLYLYVDIRSPGMNNAMKQSGFTVYVSNNEDERNRIGISYPAGTFNLLRSNNPAEYESFIRDDEWGQSQENRTLIENLEEDIFEQPMIVERYDGSDAQRGFVGMDQLEVDGVEIAINQDRRLIGLEMKIPLDDSSIYYMNDESNIWLGFEIEPPSFRFTSDYETTTRNTRNINGRNQQYSQGSQRANIRRSMGQYEEWFILNLN